ncbi:MAG: fibronectin type III domain-containing protein [Endomicrobiales bacterium]
MKKALYVFLALMGTVALPAFAQPEDIVDLTALVTTTEGQITLTWTAPDSMDGMPAPSGYLVQYATSTINSGDLNSSWVNTYAQSWTNFSLTGSPEVRSVNGLTPGVTFYFAVEAIDSNDIDAIWESSSDSDGLFNTANYALAFDTAPAQVVGVTAVEAAGSINISWTANTELDLQQYIIQRSTWSNIAGFLPLATVAAPATTFQDSSVTDGNTYYYYVQAQNTSGSIGTASAIASALVVIPPDNVTFQPISVSGPIDGSVVLYWAGAWNDAGDSTSGPCSSYVIKWSTFPITDSTFDAIAVSSIVANTVVPGGNLQTTTLDCLYPGTTFWLAIKAINSAGNESVSVGTSISRWATDLPPNSPTNVSAVAISSYAISVSWTLPVVVGYDDRDQYKIYRSSFPFSQWVAGVTTTTVAHPATFYIDTGMQNDTTYYYRVSCLDEGNGTGGLVSIVLESLLSATTGMAYITMPPTAINTISAATGGSEGQIDLSWTSPGDDGGTKEIVNGKFRVDYTTNPATNFSPSNYCFDISTTTNPGNQNSIVVTGLTYGATYYFRVWTQDQVLNWSPVSSGATAYAQLDTTAPNAINAITVTSSWRAISLAWTCPVDTAIIGNFTGVFEIRMSTLGPIALDSDWNAVPISLGYPYQIILPTTTAQGSPQSYCVTGLTDGTSYYIAIKTTDNYNNQSALSSVSPIGVPINHPPTEFSLSGPLSGTVINTPPVILSWTASSDADVPLGDSWQYNLTISTYSDLSNPIISFPTQDISAELDDDLGIEGQMLYWGVTAVDADGATTASSPPIFSFGFNWLTNPPAAFNLLAPSNSAIVTTSTPTLTWAATTDACLSATITYEVDYSLTPNFSSYSSSSGITGTSYTTPPLIEDATYWWRVTAFNGSVPTSCNNNFYLRVNAIAEPPLPFDLISPTQNQILSSSTATFSWQSTTEPDPGQSFCYEFVWSASPLFTSSQTVENLTQPTASISGLNQDGIFYWKVNAIATNGLVRTSSSTLQFLVDSVQVLPQSFSLNQPVNAVTISTTTTPFFSWTRAIDTNPSEDVRYTFDLSTRPDFASTGTISVDCASNLYYVPSVGLADMTTYYWRVRAAGYQVNPTPVQVYPGFTFSSTTGTFILSLLSHPPQAFSLVSPSNGATLMTQRPNLTWTPALDTDLISSVSYTIVIATSPDCTGVIESASGLTNTQYTVKTLLIENRSYYWTVTAFNNKNMSTACQTPFSFSIPVLHTPQAPAGLIGALSGDKLQFAISWSALATNTDNSNITDLAGYNIYRGLSPTILYYCASVGPTTTQWTDTQTQGGSWYYRVSAFNSSGIESPLANSPVINTLSNGALNYFSYDQSLSVLVPPAIAQLMIAHNNSYNKDLRIQLVQDSANENDVAILCYHMNIVASDGSTISGMTFDSPLTMQFNYGLVSSQAKRLAAQRAPSSSSAPGNLTVFWNNGIEFLRLGGILKSSNQTVTLNVSHAGEFQLRRVIQPTGFAVNSMYPKKVFTPGVDPYKEMSWYIDNPEADKVTGQVFDLRGDFVATLSPIGDATAQTVILQWSGISDQGKPVSKGVYIYQIMGSGKVINGTVIVAR